METTPDQNPEERSQENTTSSASPTPEASSEPNPAPPEDALVVYSPQAAPEPTSQAEAPKPKASTTNPEAEAPKKDASKLNPEVERVLSSDKTNPYAVLGLSDNASEAEVKKAYRKLALATHPDKQPGGLAQGENFTKAGAAFDLVNGANEKIKNGWRPSAAKESASSGNAARASTGPSAGANFSSRAGFSAGPSFGSGAGYRAGANFSSSAGFRENVKFSWAGSDYSARTGSSFDTDFKSNADYKSASPMFSYDPGRDTVRMDAPRAQNTVPNTLSSMPLSTTVQHKNQEKDEDLLDVVKKIFQIFKEVLSELSQAFSKLFFDTIVKGNKSSAAPAQIQHANQGPASETRAFGSDSDNEGQLADNPVALQQLESSSAAFTLEAPSDTSLESPTAHFQAVVPNNNLEGPKGGPATAEAAAQTVDEPAPSPAQPD